ncbi:MAG: D-2-hydroxyacid dehydrogenase [Oscillospiraceae bacterium]|nr:D-2-hydroxyacid dehydrogenase [Oscillospiraceae bacterium]
MNTLLTIRTPLFEPTPAMLLRIQEAAPGLTVRCAGRSAVTAEMMAAAEVIFGCPPPELLAAAARLRWMHITNAGIEPYGDLRLFAGRGVILTNAAGVYGTPIAEHGIGMLLALCRQFPYYVRQAGEREWLRREDVLEVCGGTAAVFGTGDLGRNLARRLKAFDCTVLGVRNNVMEKPPGIDELFPPHQKLEVLRRAQFVFSCLPRTPQTERVFDEAAFAAMPPRSVFINLGRGSAADHDALLRALTAGRLFGAGLDVTDPEPLPPESPLWGLENVLITAHSSAASGHTARRGVELFLRQLERWNAGKRLLNEVDFFRGY